MADASPQGDRSQPAGHAFRGLKTAASCGIRRRRASWPTPRSGTGRSPAWSCRSGTPCRPHPAPSRDPRSEWAAVANANHYVCHNDNSFLKGEASNSIADGRSEKCEVQVQSRRRIASRWRRSSPGPAHCRAADAGRRSTSATTAASRIRLIHCEMDSEVRNWPGSSTRMVPPGIA